MMGTNYYMFTKNKKYRDMLGDNCEIVDVPEFGYEIHVAKTSAGWLPLFQANGEINAVKTIRELYNTGDFIIYDDCNTILNWSEFETSVIKHNGGIAGVVKTVKTDISCRLPGMEPCSSQYEYVPISHFAYEGGGYANHYFKDGEGYEFTASQFS